MSNNLQASQQQGQTIQFKARVKGFDPETTDQQLSDALNKSAQITTLRMLYDQEGPTALVILPSKAELDKLLQSEVKLNESVLQIQNDSNEEQESRQNQKGLKSKSNSFYPNQQDSEVPTITKFNPDGSITSQQSQNQNMTQLQQQQLQQYMLQQQMMQMQMMGGMMTPQMMQQMFMMQQFQNLQGGDASKTAPVPANPNANPNANQNQNNNKNKRGQNQNFQGNQGGQGSNNQAFNQKKGGPAQPNQGTSPANLNQQNSLFPQANPSGQFIQPNNQQGQSPANMPGKPLQGLNQGQQGKGNFQGFPPQQGINPNQQNPNAQPVAPQNNNPLQQGGFQNKGQPGMPQQNPQNFQGGHNQGNPSGESGPQSAKHLQQPPFSQQNSQQKGGHPGQFLPQNPENQRNFPPQQQRNFPPGHPGQQQGGPNNKGFYPPQGQMGELGDQRGMPGHPGQPPFNQQQSFLNNQQFPLGHPQHTPAPNAQNPQGRGPYPDQYPPMGGFNQGPYNHPQQPQGPYPGYSQMGGPQQGNPRSPYPGYQQGPGPQYPQNTPPYQSFDQRRPHQGGPPVGQPGPNMMNQGPQTQYQYGTNIERVPTGGMPSQGGYSHPSSYNFIENEMISAPVVERKPGFNRYNKQVFKRRQIKEQYESEKYGHQGQSSQNQNQNKNSHKNQGGYQQNNQNQQYNNNPNQRGPNFNNQQNSQNQKHQKKNQGANRRDYEQHYAEDYPYESDQGRKQRNVQKSPQGENNHTNKHSGNNKRKQPRDFSDIMHSGSSLFDEPVGNGQSRKEDPFDFGPMDQSKDTPSNQHQVERKSSFDQGAQDGDVKAEPVEKAMSQKN